MSSSDMNLDVLIANTIQTLVGKRSHRDVCLLPFNCCALGLVACSNQAMVWYSQMFIAFFDSFMFMAVD
jgi:hypothetical protein